VLCFAWLLLFLALQWRATILTLPIDEAVVSGRFGHVGLGAVHGINWIHGIIAYLLNFLTSPLPLPLLGFLARVRGI
jgi:hypothetical protein